MSTDTHRPDETRAQIAQRVLRTAYEGTGSWEVGTLGAKLAYLAMAILEGGEFDLVDERDRSTAELLELLFASDDVVWDFVKKPAPVDDRIPWRPTLTIGGPTCAKMAENGEVIMRQYCKITGLTNEGPEIIIGDLLSDISHALVKAGVPDIEGKLHEAVDRAVTCLMDETSPAMHLDDIPPPVEPYDPAEFLIGADEEESE
jgi:hypothetical protein